MGSHPNSHRGRRAGLSVVRLVVSAASGSPVAVIALLVLAAAALAAVIVLIFAVILIALASSLSGGHPAQAAGPCTTLQVNSALAPVPQAMIDAAQLGQDRYQVPAEVLLAQAFVESQLGRARTGQPDSLIPAEIRQHMDVQGLAAGGAIAQALGIPDGRRPGDYVADRADPLSSDAAGPIQQPAQIHSFGLYQTHANQWWLWSQRALGRVGDPNNPDDAVLVDAWYLHTLVTGEEEHMPRSIEAALDRYNGDPTGAYHLKVANLARGTLSLSSSGCRLVGFRSGNPFGAACAPVVTQPYGPTDLAGEPIIGGRLFHTGVDLGCPAGTPVVSLTEGRVFNVVTGCQTGETRCGGGWGSHVVVQLRARLAGDSQDHDYFVTYAHLQDVLVLEGQPVGAGSVIGHEGSTGFSTGPHLHLELDVDRWSPSSSVAPCALLAASIAPCLARAA